MVNNRHTPNNKRTPDVDFRQIRTLKGRPDVAFEEFCCQIARRTKDVPPGSKFVRYHGAGGDGGVECVWMLPNGEEWGGVKERCKSFGVIRHDFIW